MYSYEEVTIRIHLRPGDLDALTAHWMHHLSGNELEFPGVRYYYAMDYFLKEALSQVRNIRTERMWLKCSTDMVPRAFVPIAEVDQLIFDCSFDVDINLEALCEDHIRPTWDRNLEMTLGGTPDHRPITVNAIEVVRSAKSYEF